MSKRIYEASVYTRDVSYKNFKGDVVERTLMFALDPLQLMQVISTVQPKKIKSGNPALNGKEEEISDTDQLKFIRDLAVKSAGSTSEDGETWIPWENFDNDLAGKAFLTKLTSSDNDRREFAEKVILDPFRAFVGFASEDEGNSPTDIANFKGMLAQMENVFKMPDAKVETIDEKRERLARELAAMGGADGSDNA